jgi:hypothetical protein
MLKASNTRRLRGKQILLTFEVTFYEACLKLQIPGDCGKQFDMKSFDL